MRRILWDVDTQADFVEPSGKLCVPGAEQARPAMARLVELARAARLPHVASADDHELTDPEISAEPDFAATWPPHCLRGTPGALRIPETQQVDPVVLGETPVPGAWLRGREFLLLKKTYDPFTNPNAEALLALLEPDEIVLFGVAADVCNDAAIRALRSRGAAVVYVEEASRGIDAERTAACAAAWRDSGVRFATVDDLTAEL